MNKAAKQKELMSVFGCTKKTRGELLLKAITGAKVDAKALFPMLESDDKITIEFGSDSYEALQPTL